MNTDNHGVGGRNYFYHHQARSLALSVTSNPLPLFLLSPAEILAAPVLF